MTTARQLRYLVERMQVRQIPAVSAIEQQSFPSAWPASAYRREIERNEMAYYVVARQALPDGVSPLLARFPVSEMEARESGLVSRLAKLLRVEDRTFTAEEAEDLASIVGYAGMWMMVDECHVTTIAVDPAFRGEGIGELLLVDLLERSMALGAARVTLECRVSNDIAQRLYRKYCFSNAGIRKRYYSDDGEDALIMTTEDLDSKRFEEAFARNSRKLAERMESDTE